MSAAPFPELAAILRILRKLELPHALVGGWAVITWGFLRASDDLDLMVELPAARRKELINALSKDYRAEWREGGEGDPISGLIRALPKREGGFPVDFLIARSLSDRAALARAREVQVEGEVIPVVGPEDLIAMKLEAGGGQDFEDARRLLAVLAGTLDESRLNDSCRERKVLKRLGLLRR